MNNHDLNIDHNNDDYHLMIVGTPSCQQALVSMIYEFVLKGGMFMNNNRVYFMHNFGKSMKGSFDGRVEYRGEKMRMIRWVEIRILNK